MSKDEHDIKSGWPPRASQWLLACIRHNKPYNQTRVLILGGKEVTADSGLMGQGAGGHG